MPLEQVKEVIDYWADEGLENIRFSGGEPTTHKDLIEIIEYAKERGVKRIALSTNGSCSLKHYKKLIAAGINDFSISFDACCASGCDEMSGVKGFFDRIITNIEELSKLTYVTVGIVVTDDNIDQVNKTIEFADQLGVADIRVISAAQYNKLLEGVQKISSEILDRHPILKYRVNNIKNGRNVRGIAEKNCSQCPLVQDDSAIVGDSHFPCIIYLREQGEAIGKVGDTMRSDRIDWFKTHDTKKDPICSKNCLDVCIDFNDKVSKLIQIS